MKIYVAGNILVDEDSFALKLLPKLREKFSEMEPRAGRTSSTKGNPSIHPRVNTRGTLGAMIEFIEIDPNENFTPPTDEPLYILDTVKGIKEITIFRGLDSFIKHKPISPHDYDLLFHLRLLKKLNKLPKEVYIIGITRTSLPETVCVVLNRLIS